MTKPVDLDEVERDLENGELGHWGLIGAMAAELRELRDENKGLRFSNETHVGRIKGQRDREHGAYELGLRARKPYAKSLRKVLEAARAHIRMGGTFDENRLLYKAIAAHDELSKGET